MRCAIGNDPVNLLEEDRNADLPDSKKALL